VHENFSVAFLAASELVVGLIRCSCDGQDARRPMRPESTMIDNAPYGVSILYRDHLPATSKLNQLTRCVATDHLHMKAAAGTHGNVKDGFGLMSHQALHPSACCATSRYPLVWLSQECYRSTKVARYWIYALQQCSICGSSHHT